MKEKKICEWQKGQMIDKYVLYKKENSVMRLETLYSVCTVQTNKSDVRLVWWQRCRLMSAYGLWDIKMHQLY